MLFWLNQGLDLVLYYSHVHMEWDASRMHDEARCQDIIICSAAQVIGSPRGDLKESAAKPLLRLFNTDANMAILHFHVGACFVHARGCSASRPSARESYR